MNEPSPTPPSGFPRWLKWALIGALAVLVVGYGAIFLYAKVLNDGPDEFDESDLGAALSVDGSTPGSGPTESSGTTGAEQVWTITDESQVGYRVTEVLFGVDTEGVGRTNRITGDIVIAGTQVVSGGFVVDVASIESDDTRRDNQFRGRIMSTDEFPEATFTLTEPIELGTEPGEDVEIATTATGELTLRGVTNTVTFEVTAQQQNGRVGVLGAIPVVFADYSIANPSTGGITTEDDGLLEFVLVFAPA
jgi:polyisoprenoid-binding protein YceI